jgi:thiosulfate dehydrogenase [quinone] large subunit
MAQPHRKGSRIHAAPPARRSPRAVDPIVPALTRQSVIPGAAILPLRAFLGITFIYAALQKMTDPGFFTLGAPSYIGTQLHGFAQGSPIGTVLLHMSEHAVVIGWLTILTELGIGVLVLLGLFTRPASLIGIVLNFMFFLSASWHTVPFFYGSDIVFVMCWATLAITGPGGFALDSAAVYWVQRLLPEPLRLPFVLELLNGPLSAEYDAPEHLVAAGRIDDGRAVRVTRSTVLSGGLLAAVLVYLGLAPRGHAAAGSVAAPKSKTAGQARGGTTPAGKQKVANIASLQPNSAVSVTDPKTGDPTAIVKLADGKVVCYDAVCTHAGCTVEYDPGYKLLVCPCHGGAYDPSQGGAVVAGPPPTPLAQIPIQVDSAGNAFIA